LLSALADNAQQAGRPASTAEPAFWEDGASGLPVPTAWGTQTLADATAASHAFPGHHRHPQSLLGGAGLPDPPAL